MGLTRQERQEAMKIKKDADRERAFNAMLGALKQFVGYAENGKHPKWATYLNTIAGEKMKRAISEAEAVAHG